MPRNQNFPSRDQADPVEEQKDEVAKVASIAPPPEAPAPSVDETVEEVEAADVEEPVVRVRLTEEFRGTDAVTLSIAGLPKPVDLKGNQTVELPVQFADSVRLSPGVEVVEEGR